jgi:hypothetical protein
VRVSKIPLKASGHNSIAWHRSPIAPFEFACLLSNIPIQLCTLLRNRHFAMTPDLAI